MLRALKFRTYGREKNKAWRLMMETEVNKFGHVAFSKHGLPALEHSYESVTVQFTGLHDCCNREIWEGDIVRLTIEGYAIVDKNDDYGREQTYQETVCVKFEDGCFKFGDDWLGSDTDVWEEQDFIIKFEVIGNRFQNPELLENTESAKHILYISFGLMAYGLVALITSLILYHIARLEN